MEILVNYLATYFMIKIFVIHLQLEHSDFEYPSIWDQIRLIWGLDLLLVNHPVVIERTL